MQEVYSDKMQDFQQQQNSWDPSTKVQYLIEPKELMGSDRSNIQSDTVLSNNEQGQTLSTACGSVLPVVTPKKKRKGERNQEPPLQ